MPTPAALVWVLACLYYKNKSFSRKAVDVLFGKVWVGKVRVHITRCDMQSHPPVCTRSALNVSTEQLNNLMYMCESITPKTNKKIKIKIKGRRGSVHLTGTPLCLHPAKQKDFFKPFELHVVGFCLSFVSAANQKRASCHE